MNHDVVIIGAGQAGLAVGHHLARRGRSFTILEAASGPGAAWRARWDSLRLFTPAQYDALPGMPFPAPADHCPTRDEVVAYLEAYASALPVEYDSRVERLERTSDGRYRLQLADRELDAAQVVVATGAFQRPFVPALAAGLSADVQQLHSADYRNPAQLRGASVLVIGGGNTGFQIAEELATTHRVELAIGSRQQPLPRRVLGRSIFAVLSATGAMDATVDSRFGQRMRGRDTLVGNGPRVARRHGVRLRPRAVQSTGRAVSFADGSTTEADAVIWATGFRPDYSWIDVPVFDAAGRPEHVRGITRSPGLAFVGLPWMQTRGSALLGWVGRDADYLAEQLEHSAPAPTERRRQAAVVTGEATVQS